MTRIFLTFPIRCFLTHQKIHSTTKVITFQSSAANVKQLYVTNLYIIEIMKSFFDYTCRLQMESAIRDFW